MLINKDIILTQKQIENYVVKTTDEFYLKNIRELYLKFLKKSLGDLVRDIEISYDEFEEVYVFDIYLMIIDKTYSIRLYFEDPTKYFNELYVLIIWYVDKKLLNFEINLF